MNKRKILKSYRLNPEMVDRVHRLALEKGCTNTHVVSMALQKYFEQNKNM